MEEQGGQDTAVRGRWASGSKGNEGVAGMVRQIPGAFGYVELIYAMSNHIPMGREECGRQVSEGKHRGSYGCRCFGQDDAGGLPDFDHECAGQDSYPISSFTWLLIPITSADGRRAKARQGLPELDAGQGRGRGIGLGYAPLPSSSG